MVLNKHLFAFTVLALIISFGACKPVKKDVNDYYPKVKTTAVTQQADGSIVVEGRIESDGATGISFYGVCADTVQMPAINANQLIGENRSGAVFSCTYTPGYGFVPLKRYYFRAWAANKDSYAAGDTMSAAGLAFDTTLIDCHPLNNYLDMESTTATDVLQAFSASTPYMQQSGGIYKVTASTWDHDLEIAFNIKPVTGKYTSAQVTVKVDNISATSVGNVYVIQRGTNQLDISLCTATVELPTGGLFHDTFNVAAKFRCYSY